MARRGRKGQLELGLKSTWGGRREGAGRKVVEGRRRKTAHRARPVHRKWQPVHVTMRARAGLRSLRDRSVFPAVRGAVAAASGEGFRVVQFSVQTDHVHLIVEAAGTEQLSSGARGLAIRIARAVNRALGRSGPVWGDRYHARPLATPREVRNGLVYVLMNFRKHLPRTSAGLDPCSSARWFEGFREGARPHAARADDVPPVASPRTWLGRVGWRRHGLIGVDEGPARIA